MVLFNYSTRELTAKIVYYGPGICGKTTNLQFIHENLPGGVRGKMLSLATKTDRTLFFDFLPIDLGEIRGMKTRVQLYTVPGQVFYNETRKLVLKGVDGIVFVADSQETMAGANVESFKNLEENLRAHGIKLSEIPHVIQFNKRDLPKLSSIEDLNTTVNKYNAPFYESVATTGIGIQDTLKAIVKLVLLNLTKKYESKAVAEAAIAAAAAPPLRAAAAPAPAPAPTPTPMRAAAPVAEPKRTTIPVSPVDSPAAKRRAEATPPPPPPAPSKSRKAAPTPPATVMSPFAESEIDSLVGEVGDVPEVELPEVEVPVAAAPMPAEPIALPSEPIAVPVAAASHDDGAWMGLREDDEAGSFSDGSAAYGSSVPLADLLVANEIADPAESVAPDAEPGWPTESHASSDFEVDRGFDPEWSPAATASPARTMAPPAEPADRSEEVVPIAPFPLPAMDEAEQGSGDHDVRLTEVASDEDLFSDPSLEIAHLVVGQTREIMVPVMLGEGANAGRFKLAIRLRLEPVD
jgi:signal recognition particle receptor subunit beta